MFSKRGFTLAEVLITLGIIGVVAAMTLPTLLQRYQKNLTVNRLKQTYSILLQAIQQSEAHNGELQYWDMGGLDDTQDVHGGDYEQNKIFYERYFKPYLKIVKTCKPNSNECWGENYKFLGDFPDNYRNGSANNSYSVVLANGTIFGVWARNTWTEIWVDINGPQNPNTAGKDVFFLMLLKDKGLIFYGLTEGADREYYKTQGYSCKKNHTMHSGAYCGALIQTDGWEIKDDYPW